MTDKSLVYEAKRMLGDTNENQRFVLHNGTTLKNIQELYESLKNMDNEIFSQHVTENNNDFSNWIKDIFKDYKLANDLFNAENKSACLSSVGSRLYELEKITASPNEIVLFPAPDEGGLINKKSSKKKSKDPRDKKIAPAVDQAQLEKTIQEINRRYWEKKKVEKQQKMKEAAEMIKTLTPEKNNELKIIGSSVNEIRSVEDLIEEAEKQNMSSSVLSDIKSIFSKDSISQTALELKNIFNKDSGVVKNKEILKDTNSNFNNPEKSDIINEIQKAHSRKK